MHCTKKSILDKTTGWKEYQRPSLDHQGTARQPYKQYITCSINLASIETYSRTVKGLTEKKAYFITLLSHRQKSQFTVVYPTANKTLDKCHEFSHPSEVWQEVQNLPISLLLQHISYLSLRYLLFSSYQNRYLKKLILIQVVVFLTF